MYLKHLNGTKFSSYVIYGLFFTDIDVLISIKSLPKCMKLMKTNYIINDKIFINRMGNYLCVHT